MPKFKKSIGQPLYLTLPLKGQPVVDLLGDEVTVQWLLPRVEVEIVLSRADAERLERALFAEVTSVEPSDF